MRAEFKEVILCILGDVLKRTDLSFIAIVPRLARSYDGRSIEFTTYFVLCVYLPSSSSSLSLSLRPVYCAFVFLFSFLFCQSDFCQRRITFLQIVFLPLSFRTFVNDTGSTIYLKFPIPKQINECFK